jgi:hypothetical protein
MAEPTQEDIVKDLKKNLLDIGVNLEYRKAGELRASEIPWRDRQPWLEEQGYMLRPRYRPGWIPSWKKSGKRWQDAEDEQIASVRSDFILRKRNLTIEQRSHLLDATRISDGALVMLKLISVSLFPHEIEISTYFSSDEMKKIPQNHCAPLYQVLHLPEDSDRAILVMPLLRRYDDPPFENTNEVLELFQQVFEVTRLGRRLLPTLTSTTGSAIHAFTPCCSPARLLLINVPSHAKEILRDCTGSNLMMDASEMYPSSFHPIRTDMSRDFSSPLRPASRSQKPPKYYFVDMGLSRKYTPDQLPPKEDVIRGGDKSPPEHLADDAEACDPFPTDVYYVGNMIRKDFFQVRLVSLSFTRILT